MTLLLPLVHLVTVGAVAYSVKPPSVEEVGHLQDTPIEQRRLLEELSRVPGFGSWKLSSEYFREETRLGTFPPVTLGSGRVLFAALEPSSGSSVVLLLLPDAIRADAETRDALAIASPAALSESWGVSFRTIWAELERRSGRRVIEVHGEVTSESDKKVALATWVPDGKGHYVIITITRPKDAGSITEVASVVMNALGAESRGPRVDRVLRVAIAVSLAVAFVLVFAFRGGSKKTSEEKRPNKS